MATSVNYRRGTTTQHNNFAGVVAELTVDTTKDTVVVHDGSTLGGFPLAREDLNNVSEIPVSKLADGTSHQLLQTAANGTDVEWTSNVDVPGTLDVTGAATFDSNVTITGSLVVNGSTTTINSTVVSVDDKLIELGSTASPTDASADQGGILLKGTTDKSIKWIDSTDAWTSSEHVDLASGKAFYINGTQVLSSTALGSNVLITSSNITDGTIVNADVNASAAIAGTKISPDFGSQTVTTTGVISPALGTAALPSIAFTGDPNTGLYSPGADQVAISTGGTGRLFVDASGNIQIAGSDKQINPAGRLLFATSLANTGTVIRTIPNGTGFASAVQVGNSSDPVNQSIGSLSINQTEVTLFSTVNGTGTQLPLVFNVGGERARIDSSGRLLVGTSSSVGTLSGLGSTLQVNEGSGVAASLLRSTNDVSGANLVFRKTRDTSPTGVTVVQNGDILGRLVWMGTDGSNPLEAARISAEVDGTPGATDMPSRLIFSTTLDGPGNTPAERMRITNTGKVGINNANPTYLLDVSGGTIRSTAGTYSFIASNGSGTSQATMGFTREGAATNEKTWEIIHSSTKDLQIRAISDDYASAQTAISVSRGTGATVNTVELHTNGSERMRITSSGSLLFNHSNAALPGIGNTNTGLTIEAPASGASLFISRDAVGLYLNRNSDGGVQEFRRSGTAVGSISVTTTATAYNTSSDYRLKENVTPVADGITRLQQLKPSRFNFIADPTKTVDGFIAHEVQTTVPEAITGEKDAVDDDGNPVYQGIDQSKLVPLLTAALQEAIAKIETLEAKVAALESA